MRGIINKFFGKKKPVDKKSAARQTGFAASRDTAQAIIRDDDAAIISKVYDLTADSYRDYPVQSFVPPASTPSAPEAPSGGWSTDSYNPSDSGSSYDSGSSGGGGSD